MTTNTVSRSRLRLVKTCVLLSAALFLCTESLAATYVGEGDLADFALEVQGDNAVLFLAEVDSNEPLHDGKVVLQGNDGAIPFTKTERAGVYTAKVAASSKLAGKLAVELHGRSETIDIEPGEGEAVSAPAKHDDGHSKHDDETWDTRSFVLGAVFGAFLLLALLGLVRLIAYRRSQKLASLLLLILAASLLLCPKPSLAHEGHDDAPDPTASAEAGADVIMTKKSQFIMGLRTMLVKKEVLPEALVSYGHVIPKPDLNVTVTAPQSGYYHLHGLVLGKKVKKAQPVSGIDAIAHIHISSPIDGEVLEIYAVEGSRVEAGAPLFRVTNTSTVWVDAELFAQDLAKLKEVSKAIAAIESLDKTFDSKIISVPTVISEETRTAKVFLEIDNSDGSIALGSIATISFSLKEVVNGIPIPSAAVLNRGGDYIVFTKYGPETFEQRQVSIRESSRPGTVLVVHGLEEGDRVVVAGNYQLMMKAK